MPFFATYLMFVLALVFGYYAFQDAKAEQRSTRPAWVSLALAGLVLTTLVAL